MKQVKYKDMIIIRVTRISTVQLAALNRLGFTVVLV